MTFLEINDITSESITEGFDKIANRLFTDYVLKVNEHLYRLLDIEFYYYAPGRFEDVYAHQHEHQLQNGKWYFHGSGIDITFGNGINHGGILIRAIGSLTGEADARNNIKKDIHGPLNVKTEICSRLNGVFDQKPHVFHLENISMERMGAGMLVPEYIVKTKRIGLNPSKDNQEQHFYNGKFRYVIFPYLKLRDKTTIAHDMLTQFPELGKEGVNKELGSKFLK
jgi:hypothetical protein